MGRFAIVVACVAAFLAVPQVAFGAPALVAHNCGSNCGSLYATGKGTLNVNGNGSEWGSVAGGTVKIQDKSKNGHRDWSITIGGKACRTSEDPSNPAIQVCKSSKTMTFSTSTVWWLSVSGSGVNASAVASGGFYIKGSSGYFILNSGKRKSWPSGGKYFQL